MGKYIVSFFETLLKCITIFANLEAKWGQCMKIYGINGKKNAAGVRIKAVRQQKGWTQAELAAKLQIENVIVEQKAISRMELGTRLIADYELGALANVLKVSAEWLIFGGNAEKTDSGKLPKNLKNS